MKAVKPGVVWTDMHVLANRVILEDLLQGGLVKVRRFTVYSPNIHTYYIVFQYYVLDYFQALMQRLIKP